MIKKVFNKLRNVFFNAYLPFWYRLYTKNSFLNTACRPEFLVASIASFPARIHTLHLTIESLLRQSVKLDKIMVYLEKDEFGSIEIPSKLNNLKKKGVEIVFVKEHLRSHKKYFFAIQAYPDAIVMTFDDDIIYNHRVVETLMDSHRMYPNCVVGTRCTRMLCDENGVIFNYMRWKRNDATLSEKPSFYCFPSGVGGVLYPPKALAQEAFNCSQIYALCPLADDIWLKTMELLKGTSAIQTKRKFKLVYIKNLQKGPTLVSKNIAQGDQETQNDVQLKNICKSFDLSRYFKI